MVSLPPLPTPHAISLLKNFWQKGTPQFGQRLKERFFFISGKYSPIIAPGEARHSHTLVLNKQSQAREC